MKLCPLVRVLIPILSALLFWGCSAESKRAKVLERAGQHFKVKEFEKARIEYQNVLQTAPDHVEATERMGLIWLERGSPVRAAGYLSKLKSIAPGNLAMRLKLAQILFDLGSVSEARREALAILSRTSSFPDAYVLLAETVRSSEDLKQAEQVLDKVTEKASVPYLIASGHLMLIRGDVAGAKANFERAIARDPNGIKARFALAGMLAAQGLVLEARTEYKRAAEIAADSHEAKLRHATYLMQTGGAAEAEASLREMTRRVPDYLPAWRALVQLAVDRRNFPEAQSLVQTVLTKEPFDYEIRVLRASIWRAMGEPRKAVEDLELFGRDFPGLGIEKHELALGYLAINDRANASKTLQEVVVRNPDNVDAQLRLAQLKIQSGAYQDASVSLAALVHLRPTLVQAYPLLIEAMRGIGRLDQAVASMERSVSLSPKNVQLHLLLGMLRMQLCG